MFIVIKHITIGFYSFAFLEDKNVVDKTGDDLRLFSARDGMLRVIQLHRGHEGEPGGGGGFGIVFVWFLLHRGHEDVILGGGFGIVFVWFLLHRGHEVWLCSELCIFAETELSSEYVILEDHFQSGTDGNSLQDEIKCWAELDWKK